MNMHQPTTELQRQHQAHLERKQRMAAPIVTDREGMRLRKEVAELTVEIGVLKESLSQATETISKLISSRSDMEGLILTQAKRICQLEGITAKPDGGRRSVVAIIKDVLEDYPLVTVDDICGVKRSAHIVEPRHKAVAKVYEERPDLSLVEIAKHFGGRDHSVILHAAKKHGVWRGGKN